MTIRISILLGLLMGLVISANAQVADENIDKRQERKSAAKEERIAKSLSATPQDMWEFGVTPGHSFVSGDVAFESGYGLGFHIRKATDYSFSLRFDANYSMIKGMNAPNNAIREFEGSMLSATGYGVLSLNNLRWDKSVRKLNYFAMVGAGGNAYEIDYNFIDVRNGQKIRERGTIEREPTAHIAAGAGISFRVNNRVNVGIEHQSFLLLGNRADLLDGVQGGTESRTAFRDIFNFTGISVNINLGNPSTNTEPLYWINPLDKVIKNVADVRARQEDFITDSDYDGVIDALDQEPNTPRAATVDTKGRTLDSDRDGVPDYKDKEPYYTPRPGETVNSLGVVENPVGGRGGVSEDRVKELIDEALQDLRNDPSISGGNSNNMSGGAAVTEWFLPMIHFGSDSYTIKYSDYGTLASISRMMKGNPNFKLVITGFTDQTAPENYNNNLSYGRAKSVVDHLVNNHGIGRGRLILQWKGEGEALVPFTSSYMNRRVEFRVARPNDVEQDPPSTIKSDGY